MSGDFPNSKNRASRPSDVIGQFAYGTTDHSAYTFEHIFSANLGEFFGRRVGQVMKGCSVAAAFTSFLNGKFLSAMSC